MVQYGIKTDHLEHLGDHGPEMIQNGIEDDNPGQGYVSFNQPLRRVCVLQPTPPTGMCFPFGTPPSGSLQPTLPIRRARAENKIRGAEEDTGAHRRGHVRTPFEAHEKWSLKETNLRA